MFREAPEPEQNRLLRRAEFGGPLPEPGGSRTEVLGRGQAGKGEQVGFGRRTHHQAAERRTGPGQGHRAAFDGLRTAGKRSVEEQPAGGHLPTAGALQEEGLRRDEGWWLHHLHAGRSEGQKDKSAELLRETQPRRGRSLTSSRRRRRSCAPTSCSEVWTGACRTPGTETGHRSQVTGGRCCSLPSSEELLEGSGELTRLLLLLQDRCSPSVRDKDQPEEETLSTPRTSSPSLLCSPSVLLTPSPSAGCWLGLLVAVATRDTGPEGERSGGVLSLSSAAWKLDDCSLETETLG